MEESSSEDEHTHASDDAVAGSVPSMTGVEEEGEGEGAPVATPPAITTHTNPFFGAPPRNASMAAPAPAPAGAVSPTTVVQAAAFASKQRRASGGTGNNNNNNNNSTATAAAATTTGGGGFRMFMQDVRAGLGGVMNVAEGIKLDSKDFVHHAHEIEHAHASASPTAASTATAAAAAGASSSTTAAIIAHGGWLVKQGQVNTGSWKRRWFSIHDNVLYYYQAPRESNAMVIGMLWLEGAAVHRLDSMATSEGGQLPNDADSLQRSIHRHGGYPLQVTSCSGRSTVLVAQSAEECDGWVAALQGAQFASARRALADAREQNASLLADQRRIQSEADTAVQSLRMEADELRETLARLREEHEGLLSARGLVVRQPVEWMQQQRSRRYSARGGPHALDTVKVWAGSWNMGAEEPFTAANRGRGPSILRKVGLVPPGYDLYLLGVQECVGEGVFNAMEGLLGAEGCVRVHLHGHGPVGADFAEDRERVRKSATPSDGGDDHQQAAATAAAGHRHDRIYGRGDGSLLGQKFTGVALYCRASILDKVEVLSVANAPFATGMQSFGSKGSVGFALRIGSGAGAKCNHNASRPASATGVISGRAAATRRNGGGGGGADGGVNGGGNGFPDASTVQCEPGTFTTLAFLTCHMEAKKNEVRREQYRTSVACLGQLLGEGMFGLNEQFHHVVWTGDFNYRCTGVGSQEVVRMLEQNRVRELYERHDQMRMERTGEQAFFNYREPEMQPDFFPTYKKYENRRELNFNDPAWVKQCYRVRYKEPFYKGGKVKERIPGWCDRVLVHSLAGLADSMPPERVPLAVALMGRSVDFPPAKYRGGALARAMGGGRGMFGGSKRTDKAAAPELASQSSSADSTSGGETVLADNYRSINNGECMSISDHSPVLATFLLRLPVQHRVPCGGGGEGGREQRASILNEIAAACATFRVRITNIHLLWNDPPMRQSKPEHIRVCFPAPFEDSMAFRTGTMRGAFEPPGPLGMPRGGGSSASSAAAVSAAQRYGAAIARWQIHSSESGTVTRLDARLPENVNAAPPLSLLWRGHEPVHSLHVLFSVATVASTLEWDPNLSHPDPARSRTDSADHETTTGQCAIALDQLLPVSEMSLAGSYEAAGSPLDTVVAACECIVPMTRDGLPMYCVDINQNPSRVRMYLRCNVELEVVSLNDDDDGRP